MPDDDNERTNDQQANTREDQNRTGDAASSESRGRVQRGGEPDTDALGNADGAS